jgi:hypothetical protein
MRTIYIVVVSFLIAAGAHAESKAFGDWIVTTDRDRFTDKTNVVAINFTNDGAVAMRCLAGNLSLALTQARTKYTEGVFRSRSAYRPPASCGDERYRSRQ